MLKKLRCAAAALVLPTAALAAEPDAAMLGSAQEYAASEVRAWPSLPRLQKPLELEYPLIASRARLEGALIVEVLVDAQGKPQKTIIRSRTPRFIDLFDAPARAAVMRASFDPALDSDGKPVAAVVRQPISFKLHGFDEDHSATCIVDAAPHYPSEARALGAEGLVGVLVKIDQTGWIDNASIAVVGREPANANMFDKAAKAAVVQARCRAARHMGRSIESYAVIEVPFKVDVSGAPKP
ncbi:TonB family protein [Variovorax sp. DT-64]|uniref:TonB family protein n=1 Tax=Variovorax sp. DT-64 TaxID=3396160 RepID=UPI003F193A21